MLTTAVLAAGVLAAGQLPTSTSASTSTTQQAVAKTADGAVRGATTDGVDHFLGLPYAAPPVQDLRFRPPQPVRAWRGVREATTQAPACLQFQGGGVPQTQETSEDCLYLDLYRPQGTRPGERLPVVLWIHGGAYTQGSGVIYGGQSIAARTNSIVISVNYRLGALGYLALDQLDAENPATGSGNWALLDQIAALRWAKTNVAAFGGDPRNVTIAGQSAGGTSVCTLLASPAAAGLFQRAAVQSAFCEVGERPLTEAQSQGVDFAQTAGCTDAGNRLACLRDVRGPDLVSAFQQVGTTGGPVVGTPLLPRRSAATIESGRWNKVPVLVGATAHEGRLFLSGTPNITAADYQNWLTTTFGENADDVAALYPLSDYPAPFYAQAQALGDRLVYCAADRTADLLARQTVVHRYEFDDPNSPTLAGAQPPGIDMSSTHSSELAYLFDLTVADRPVPDSSHRLADQMKRYWGSFAKDADPNDRGLPRWPTYNKTGKTLVLRPTGPVLSSAVSQNHHCGFWADQPHPS